MPIEAKRDLLSEVKKHPSNCECKLHSQEYREELSKRLSGVNNPFFGRHHTEANKQFLSKLKSGRRNPKLSELRKKFPIKYWEGKSLPEQMRQKISESKKGLFLGNQNPAWKGGGLDWWRQRIKREGRTQCEKCGRETVVCIHHKDGNSKNNTPENFLLLCRGCHRRLHEAAFYVVANAGFADELCNLFLQDKRL